MSDDFLKNPLALFDIKGKTAIITGASGAFGALSAEALCAKAEATPAHFWRRYWAGGRTSARRACRQRSDQRSKRTMTVKTLVLFPDTNLFVQCRALSEIDWTDLYQRP